VSFEFLTPAPTALARSPMERQALAAGARLEQRDGWSVAAAYDGEGPEHERCRSSAGYADRSHLGKIELQGPHDLPLGQGTRRDDAWWCPLTPDKALVLCEPADTAALLERLEATSAQVVDLTSALAALTVAGPLAPEVFARFTAIDLRDAATPVEGFRPGSVGRTPGAILREGGQSWLMLFGSALGSYMWTVVADAAENLGGGPVGVDALTEAAIHA
jgi:heterotetrameric sarcosine oxidase gamma subunit